MTPQNRSEWTLGGPLEQITPHSRPIRPSAPTTGVRIVGVSVGKPRSTYVIADVTGGKLVRFVELKRDRWALSELVTIVRDLKPKELVLNQTLIGRHGAAQFAGIVKPHFTRVSIAPPPGEGGGGYHFDVAIGELIRCLTIEGDVEVRFEGTAGDADLRAEMRSAQDADEHSDMLLAVAIVVWYVRLDRNRNRLARA